MTTDITHTRIAAERAVLRGDLTEAARFIEEALSTALPEHRPDLEEARAWLDDLMPARDSAVGDA